MIEIWVKEEMKLNFIVSYARMKIIIQKAKDEFYNQLQSNGQR